MCLRTPCIVDLPTLPITGGKAGGSKPASFSGLKSMLGATATAAAGAGLGKLKREAGSTLQGGAVKKPQR